MHGERVGIAEIGSCSNAQLVMRRRTDTGEASERERTRERTRERENEGGCGTYPISSL
jgi:hypothetical protein